jgi:hypothetical protein
VNDQIQLKSLIAQAEEAEKVMRAAHDKIREHVRRELLRAGLWDGDPDEEVGNRRSWEGIVKTVRDWSDSQQLTVTIPGSPVPFHLHPVLGDSPEKNFRPRMKIRFTGYPTVRSNTLLHDGDRVYVDIDRIRVRRPK